ncbi:DUF664 domain-containing protein [Deinococcus multiflagellatus]|uniref:DUF664 domain-containing protein n=1 Tax=Deinococcus multiflagellatus TaxID=1656887 RepID=A0ABW1ZJR3_9DEIO
MTAFAHLATTLKDDRAFQIRTGPPAPFTPQIAALADMLTYARLTTLQAVADMTPEELDAVPPGLGNSCGMLLAHLAAVHRIYHALSFEGYDPYDSEAFAPTAWPWTWVRRRGRSFAATIWRGTRPTCAGRWPSRWLDWPGATMSGWPSLSRPIPA